MLCEPVCVNADGSGLNASPANETGRKSRRSTDRSDCVRAGFQSVPATDAPLADADRGRLCRPTPSITGTGVDLPRRRSDRARSRPLGVHRREGNPAEVMTDGERSRSCRTNLASSGTRRPPVSKGTRGRRSPAPTRACGFRPPLFPMDGSFSTRTGTRPGWFGSMPHEGQARGRRPFPRHLLDAVPLVKRKSRTISAVVVAATPASTGTRPPAASTATSAIRRRCPQSR